MFRHPSPAEARRAGEAARPPPPEAVMDSHDRQVGSRWPSLGPACGSGGCEFCPRHLPKRAVDLVQRDATSCVLADCIVVPVVALKALGSLPQSFASVWRLCRAFLSSCGKALRQGSWTARLSGLATSLCCGGGGQLRCSDPVCLRGLLLPATRGRRGRCGSRVCTFPGHWGLFQSMLLLSKCSSALRT